MKKCIVVGGGASGMMAAIAAADKGYDVTLYEKNEKLGKKIYITGKGRCNVTNDCDADTFFSNVVSNKKFLYSAYYSYDNNMVRTLIEEAGCRLKVERGGRVFPISDHSSDIIKALATALENRGVKVILSKEVLGIVTKNSIVTGVRFKDGSVVEANRVIIATGGLSYSSTGSTGDGHRWLKELGHDVVDCKPALVPLTCADDWYRELQGLTLKNIEVALYSNDEYVKHTGGKKCKIIYQGFGEMLFTHFGISGPLILSASSYLTKSGQKEGVLTIDLKPALTKEQLNNRLLREFEENINKNLKNVINSLLPSRLVQVFCDIAGLDCDKPVNIVTKEERAKIISFLKELPVGINGTRDFNEAIITQGGISVKDIDPSTMESKLVNGLYVAGELIDVDALTGGYNLQIAWSTGHLAGDSI